MRVYPMFCLLALMMQTIYGYAQTSTTFTLERDAILAITQFEDEYGRVFMPQGFVANTHVTGEQLDYLPEDYRRMTRYGANMQVIRIGIRRLGAWPGMPAEPGYLEQIDTMIDRAAAVGIKSSIKLVIYDVKDFKKNNGWEAIWKNEHGEHEALLAGWEKIWTRYKDNPNVFAYDLLNEPMRGHYEDPAKTESEALAPLYLKLIDRLQEIDPTKWACYQPVHLEPTTEVFSPFWPWTTVLNRERIIFAPHTYEYTFEEIAPRLDAYLEQAAINDAKLFLGEWGPATYNIWDTDKEGQDFIKANYERACKSMDARSIGGIKAWFTATPRWTGIQKNATWAIFSERAQMGTAERKYIVDYICRPHPIAVAGSLEDFTFDFQQRIFMMDFTPQALGAPTEIYVPANRHYPDGFHLVLNGERIFELRVNPDYPGFLEPVALIAPGAGLNVEWDAWAQRIKLRGNALTGVACQLQIAPGYTRPD